MDWVRRSVDTFQTAWSGFPVSYRVLTGFLLVLLALVATWGVSAASRDGWVRIVDGDMTLEKRSEIARMLKDQGIDFRVDGVSISVPSARADEAMLQLHSSGALGDEPFFKFLKETSPFATRDNTDRQWLLALQGQLAARIQNLTYVRRAWVQIAEPSDPKAHYWANGREATAAVILELESSEKMTGLRVHGIAALVSAARSDIKPSGVKILDLAGQVFRVSESDSFISQVIRTQELEIASSLESKALVVLPPNSRVAVTVRLNAESRKVEHKSEERNGAIPPGVSVMSEVPADTTIRQKTENRSLGVGYSIEFVSVAALIPDSAADVPREGDDRAAFLREVTSGLRTATGAQEKDISIRIAPLPSTFLMGAIPAAEPLPRAGFRVESGHVALILLGVFALAAVYKLVRGMAPVTDGGVVAEESLRSPGESILSAQDEVLDKIRDGVRESVTRNPREAADVARRWMAP